MKSCFNPVLLLKSPQIKTGPKAPKQSISFQAIQKNQHSTLHRRATLHTINRYHINIYLYQCEKRSGQVLTKR